MLRRLSARLQSTLPASTVDAHCDGPCGIYDPASARIAAEAVRSMVKKIHALHIHDENDATEVLGYHNSLSRYIAIKEEEAETTKRQLLILWTDYFKPHHLEAYPDLHDTFWKAAKLCSACKVGIKLEDANALVAACENIHNIFWATKNRDVKWELAGG